MSFEITSQSWSHSLAEPAGAVKSWFDTGSLIKSNRCHTTPFVGAIACDVCPSTRLGLSRTCGHRKEVPPHALPKHCEPGTALLPRFSFGCRTRLAKGVACRFPKTCTRSHQSKQKRKTGEKQLPAVLSSASSGPDSRRSPHISKVP